MHARATLIAGVASSVRRGDRGVVPRGREGVLDKKTAKILSNYDPPNTTTPFFMFSVLFLILSKSFTTPSDGRTRDFFLLPK